MNSNADCFWSSIHQQNTHTSQESINHSDSQRLLSTNENDSVFHCFILDQHSIVNYYNIHIRILIMIHINTL